ncbi:unnamed protein product [Brachionus calyciflorus]|uniref:TNase-like domain-containing protein n=1 Tax=Brachionus calyciflorus TaxID=104777 RepID=A0A814M5H5_9BILA|nr:unnamed protein product [Brachionus calyciflorus]
MISKFLFICVIVGLAALASIHAQLYKVTKVYDGDTITVLDGSSGKYLKIRFKCIDAPEIDQTPWGALSQNRLNQLTPLDTYIQLRNSSLDQYGRTLAEVYTISGVNINEKLVREGYCVYYYKQSGCGAYKPIQDAAKVEKLNVWSDPNFIMPWDFRNNKTVV